MKKWMMVVVLVLLVSACSTTVTNQNGGKMTEMAEMQQGVRLATQAMEQFASLDKLLETAPAHSVSGNGDLPCERHDGSLWIIEGDNKRDVVKCSWGSEIVITRGGNDQVDAGRGNDALSGGAGNDTLDGGWGNEVIYGGPGNDTIKGGWGDEVINGGPGDDHINTSWGNAVILFGHNWGHDTLDVDCRGTTVALIFSKEIHKDDLVWKKDVLEDTKTHSKITFSGSTQCLNTIHSKESFS